MQEPSAVNLALNWLVESNIRHANGNETARGGINQGYNWQAQNYPYIYSEITGYAVSMFTVAYGWTNDERYLKLAREAADYLLRMQILGAEDGVRGSIPHGLSLPELKPLRQYYSFDVAMCLQGLMDLYAVQPEADLLDAGRAAGDWLISMQEANGSFLAMYDAETGERLHPGSVFYDDHGCLHSKHTIGLLKLGRATSDARYAAAARKAADWVLGLQDADGAFRASESLAQIVSHPHCYTMEGLLYAHYDQDEERYLKAALRAGEWLLGAQNADGSISIAYKQNWLRMGRRITEMVFPRRVTDATSQSIRMWLLLYYLKGDERFLDAARKAGDFLRKMQCVESADQNAVGGFYFWPGHPIMFTWATMFSAHALYALENVERQGGYRHLITELF